MLLLKQSLFFFTFLTISFGLSRAAYCKSGNGGSKIAYTITVDKFGRGKFSTIQGAIDSIPPGNNKWIKIQINPGIYTEQVTIPENKPYIVLEGQGRSVTTITYNAHEKTDTSATFTSISDNVVVKGITFKNSYNRAVKLDIDSRRLGVNEIKQAVAARIYGDKSAFCECGFIGVQDTLWDAQGRHYFYKCYIEGAIDFIFGSGQSFYEDCLINAIIPSQKSTGYITAQGRASLNDPSGFVFRRGIVFGKGQVLLGRAYGPYSRVIFYGTTLTSVVAPQGWNAWHYQGHEGNLMYSEINCGGPGSDTSKRVSWERKLIPALHLNQFSRSSFIDRDGWLATLP